MKPARARRTAAAAALAVLALAGCSTPQAGTAVLVGSQSVSDSDIARMVSEVSDTLAGVSGTPFDEALATKANVNRTARHLLLTEAGKREGVTVTQSDIDNLITKTTTDSFAGDTKKFQQALTAQSLVPPSEFQSFAGDVLMTQALKTKLAPGAADDAAATVKLDAYLAPLGKEIGIEIAPRFGSWSFDTATLSGVPDDISTPVASPSASPSATGSSTSPATAPSPSAS